MYICFAQFANLRKFKIPLHKLEILKLQTNFKIVQPFLDAILMAKGRIAGELKPTLFLSELELGAIVHCYGVTLEQSYNLISLTFQDCFAHFDWYSVLRKHSKCCH